MLRGLCSQVAGLSEACPAALVCSAALACHGRSAGQVVFLAGLRRPKQFAKKRIQSLIDNSISQILAYRTWGLLGQSLRSQAKETCERMGLDMISINALIPDSERSIQKLREEEEARFGRVKAVPNTLGLMLVRSQCPGGVLADVLRRDVCTAPGLEVASASLLG